MPTSLIETIRNLDYTLEESIFKNILTPNISKVLAGDETAYSSIEEWACELGEIYHMLDGLNERITLLADEMAELVEDRGLNEDIDDETDDDLESITE